jgi:1,2-diacylglycerol 3-alpha-glucosyltransferase
MRVLMVSDVYFPRVNGVSTSMQTFRRSIAANGVDVRLIVPSYGGEPDEEGITRVPGRPVPRDPEDRLMAWGRLRTAALREATHCDLIHIQTPFAAHYAGVAAARKLSKPVLATYHTLFEEYVQYYLPPFPRTWLSALARRLSRSQCNALDAVIVPSKALHARLASYGVSTPLHILPTGIVLKDFTVGDGTRFRVAHGIEPGRPVALFVGRVAFEKNIDFLLDVLVHARTMLPELLLLITGDGPAVPALKQRVASLHLGDSVRFLGYLERTTALPDCYAAADVFVFSSRTETQGLVLLEAMAMGLPVVALSAMGTADILDPGHGCIAPQDEPRQFAEAILRILTQPELRRRLAQQAREYARQWSDDALAHRLACLYRSLVDKANGAAKWSGEENQQPLSDKVR